MLKKIAFLILILLILGLIGVFYVNKVILPVKVREIIMTRGEEFLQRKVELDSITYHPLKGVLIHNLTIFQKDRPDQPLLRVTEASFNVLLTPFLKEKKIIIPVIHLTSPEIQLVRMSDDQWNFSDLLKRPPSDSPSKNTLLLKKVMIHKGRVDYQDLRRDPVFYESLKDVEFSAEISVMKQVRFFLAAQLLQRNSAFKIDGQYDLKEKALQAQTETRDIQLHHYLNYFLPDSDFQLKTGTVTEANLKVAYAPNRLRLEGQLRLDDANLVLPGGETLGGNVDFTSLTVEKRESGFSGKGQGEWQNFSFKKDDNHQIASTVIFQITTFRTAPQEVSFKGNATLNNTTVQWDHQQHSGTFAFKDASFIRKSEEWRAQGIFALHDGQLKWGDRQSFSGQILDAPLVISRVNHNWTVRGSILTDPITFQWGEQQSLTGKIALPTLDASLREGKLQITSALQMEKGRVQLTEDRWMEGTLVSPQITFTREEGALQVASPFRLVDGVIQITPSQTLRGSPNGNISITHNRQSEIPLQYEGEVHLQDAILLEAPYLGPLNNIKTSLQFSQDRVRTDRMSFDTRDGALVISGLIENFRNPQLDINVQTTTVDLETILAQIPNPLTEKGYALTGTAEVQAQITGPLRTPKQLQIFAKGDVHETTLSGGNLPHPVSNVNGHVEYQGGRVAWDKLSARYQDKTYHSTGHLQNFSAPLIDAHVKSDDFDIKGNVKLSNQNHLIQINSAAGTYSRSLFDVSGAVDTAASSPKVNLTGRFNLDLLDLALLPVAYRQKVTAHRPQGNVFGDFTWKGDIKQWQQWLLEMNLRSPDLTLASVPLKNVTVQWSQNQGMIQPLNLRGKIFDGTFEATGHADVGREHMPSRWNVVLEGVSLAAFSDYKNLQRKMSGTLSGAADLQMPLSQPLAMEGQGVLEIREGRIYEWKVLQGLLGALLIPEFTDVVFKEGAADFQIKNQTVNIPTVQLKSDRVTLNGQGTIGFDKSLDLQIVPKFSEIAVINSDSLLKKMPTSFLTQTEGYIQINVSGTLDKPQYKVDSFPLKVIEKTTDILLEGIGGMLEGLF